MSQELPGNLILFKKIGDNNVNFPPTGETITSLVSGEHGDFLVVTDTGSAPPNNRKVYYGKEGYFRLNILEVTFANESTDSTCQECNFALQVFSLFFTMNKDPLVDEKNRPITMHGHWRCQLHVRFQYHC